MPILRSFSRTQWTFTLVALLVPSLTLSAASDEQVEIQGRAYRVETFAEPLNRPWGMAQLPDGDLLVTEKNGGLQRIDAATRAITPVSGLPSDLDRRLETPIDNTGLFDVALAVDFETSGRLYLSYASEGSGGSALAVARYHLQDDALVAPDVLLLAGPRSRDRFHYGGALLPLSDGTLLVTVGERLAFEKPQGDVPIAQDGADLRGKVLRIDAEGHPPRDNPFIGRRGFDPRVYAVGVRNPQGLARMPDGTLWLTDHGPRQGDELNRLEAGANYGWPAISCGEYKDRDYAPPVPPANAIAPSLCWRDRTVAPAGIAVLLDQGDRGGNASLLIGGLSTGDLLHVSRAAGDATLGTASVLAESPRRIRDVMVAPDESIFLAVDGERGQILRLVPVSVSTPRRATGERATEAIVVTSGLSECLACHALAERDGRPALARVFGHRAASQPGVRYSRALRASGIEWSEETLDAYLENPSRVVPGTTMTTTVAAATHRAGIIEALRALSRQ